MEVACLNKDDIIDLKDYEVREMLTDTEGSEYYEVVKLSNGDNLLAKSSTKNLKSFNQSRKISFHREVDIHSRIIFPSILQFVGYSMTNFNGKLNPTILMEFPLNINLKNPDYKYLKKNIPNVDKRTKKLITLYGIASAMKYLHSHNIIHRNLSYDSVFYDIFDYPNLSGLDYAIEITDEEPIIKETHLLCSKDELLLKNRFAPETLSNLEYSKSSDVFAFSEIIRRVMHPPIDTRDWMTEEELEELEYDDDDFNDYSKIEDEEENIHPTKIKKNYEDLYLRCRSKDPKLRPTFDDIVTELKTNQAYLNDKIDIEEFQKYVKYIDELPQLFKPHEKRKRTLDQILKEKVCSINYFNKAKLNSPAFTNTNSDLSKYKPVCLENELKEYKVFKMIDNNNNVFLGQIYNKEINGFCRNEIINFYRKLNVLSQINHPSILNIIGFGFTSNDNKQVPVILTEFCDGFYSKAKLSITRKLSIIYAIASAMAYLHSHDIIHRDLKTDNILLYNNILPKLTGFDISKQLNDNTIDDSDKIKGTPIYIAPEVYLNKEYSKASDVYSFGLVMYEIITDFRPFGNLNTPSQIKKNVAENGELPKYIDPIYETYRKLIERCLSKDPKDRPTFDQIMIELKTDPKYITDEINKSYYFNFIKFIDESPTYFDPSKRINQFDEMITNYIDTFSEFKTYLSLNNMYETETNNLSFDYNFYNLIGDVNTYYELRGGFYKISVIYDKKGNKTKSYILKQPIVKMKDLTQNEVNNFNDEIKILSQLNHPCIIKLIGYSPSILKQDIHSLIVEYLGDYKYLLTEKKMTNKMIVTYGIASAMNYLHSHDIIHRDLKIKNVLLDRKKPKLSGFNIAKQLNKNKPIYKSKHIKGTPAYLAPEVYSNNEYSKASDVYSFGFLVFELFTNEKAFNYLMSPRQIKKEIQEDGKRPEFTKPINEIYKNLIERCWSQKPEERPTFEQIVTELKTNPELIKNKKYLSYIEYIDNEETSFDPSKKITQIEETIKYQRLRFKNYNFKINYRNSFETEFNEILFNYDFIDIKNFTKKLLIYKDNDIKIYHFTTNDPKHSYLAKKYKLLFNISQYEDYLQYNYMKKKMNEINLIMKIDNHPSFLKFIGYSPLCFCGKSSPFIVTEYGSNGSLESILEIDIRNHSKSLLNETKRLIILYGIASGMAYLHSKKVIYVNLKTSCIYLDEFLFPKISILNISNEMMDTKNEENLIYYPPELFNDKTFDTPGDVYAFAMIAYQLITNEKPYSNVNEDVNDVDYRPKFNDSIPQCYVKLIEDCWSPNQEERPTFDYIVNYLETNEDIIDNDTTINKEEYKKYIFLMNKFKSNKNNDDYGAFRQINVDIKKIRENSMRLNFSINIGSIDLNLYEKRSKIGSGAFGVVYSVVEKDTYTEFAAKETIKSVDFMIEDEIKNLSREIYINSQLHHPCIIKFIGFNPYSFDNEFNPTIIIESASNGDLKHMLSNERRGISDPNWNETKKLINIYGIAFGMAYMHNHNILHRDLKPENILLDDYLFPKIADFGLSKFIYYDKVKDYNKDKNNMGNPKGTPSYMSPEIILKQKYTKAGDVYAFGLIVYQIITGEDIYEDIHSCFVLYKKVTDGYRPEFKFPIPYCYRKLIENCWSESIHRRPDFSEIVELLETDPSFVTQNVDKDEYFDYIDLIKSQLNDDNYQANYSIFKKVTLDANYKSENDMINLLYEQNIDSFLNLDKFEKLTIIKENSDYKSYQIQNIETNDIFMGQISNNEITQISEESFNNHLEKMNIIKKLKHHCLLQFIGYSLYDFEQRKKSVLITELTTNGCLNDVLQIVRNDNENELISEWNETKKLINIYGIAKGMSYLHNNGIIHRSLNPENIYLDEILSPKIGDFGLMTDFVDFNDLKNQSYMINNVENTRYSAPEVLQSNEYSKCSDVYAFGLIVFEIMSNEIPFNDIDNSNEIYIEVVNKKNRPKLNKMIPKKYQDLINKCWNQDPDKRPSFDEIVNELESDSEFITEKVNKIEYQKYLKLVGQQIDIESNTQNDESSLSDQVNQKCESNNEINKLYPNFNDEIETEQRNPNLNEKNIKYLELNKEQLILNDETKNEKDQEKQVSHDEAKNEKGQKEQDPHDETEAENDKQGQDESENEKDQEKQVSHDEAKNEKGHKEQVSLDETENDKQGQDESENEKDQEKQVSHDEAKNEKSHKEQVSLDKQGQDESKNDVGCFIIETEKIEEIENEISQNLINENPLRNSVLVEDQSQLNPDGENRISSISFYRAKAEQGDYEAQEFLAKKYIQENDTENIYKYFCMLIKSGKCAIPLEYAVNLYHRNYFRQSFKFFTLISEVNHPIAQYFIGTMKYNGFGCTQDKEESFRILKNLADNGIDQASEFLKYHYDKQ